MIISPSNPNEDKIQAAFYAKVTNDFPLTRLCLFAVPNGGSRDDIEAMKMMATGTLAGVLDMIFYWKGKTYWLEFKDDDGRVSKDQQFFMRSLDVHGFEHYLVRNVEVPYKIIKDIITNNPLTVEEESTIRNLLRERLDYKKEQKAKKQKRNYF